MTAPVSGLCRKMMCGIGRHRFSVIGQCGYAAEHVGCEYCGRQWGMNHDASALLPWANVGYFYRARGYRETEAVTSWRGRIEARAAIRAVASCREGGPEMNEAPAYNAPWQCVSANKHHGAFVQSADGRAVCDLYHQYGSVIFHFLDAAANARLIAAAPELLEALRLMVSTAETGTCSGMDRAVLTSRKAIAKATGIYEGGYDAD